MKKISYITVAALMLPCFVSCKKSFLEITPMQDVAADQAISNLPGAKAAVTGLYGSFQSAAYYGRTFPLYADLSSDNMYVSRRNSNRYHSFDQYNVTITDSYASGLWNQLYRIIVNANILIKRAGEIEIPATQKAEMDHILGEAYTIRALAHFDLLRLFAMPYNATAGGTHLGVPVITSGDYSVVISPLRNTVNEGYTQIIDDLKKAATLMPASPVGFSSSLRGKVTLNAAKALLSRVYLYREDWANAEALATEVIDAKKYTLLPNATYAADFRIQNNSETIFEIQYASTDNLSSDAMVNFTKQGGSYGDGLATDNLYAIYTETDARRGHLLQGRRTGSGGENPAIQITKFDNGTTFEEGIKVVRLSEVYLTRAEALAKQSKEKEAIADLDVIRFRADSKAVATVATGNALLDLIQTERRKELFLEGHRLFDLTRTRQNFTKHRTGDLTMAISNTSLKTILPIPSSEMGNNKNMVQNDGYK